MARTPRQPEPLMPPDVNTEVVAQDLAAADQATVGDMMVMQYEEITRQLGQIDSMEFMRRVADVAQAQIFERVRKSGAYKGYPYQDGGILRHVASIEEFCEVKLGKSYRRCMDLSQNLRVLGPELYEQSERLGLRNVDYKALRALPADDQVLIRQAIEEAKSRDDVLDILREMAVRHAQEKEALTKEAIEAAESIQIKDGQLKAKDEKINELDAKLSKPQAAPEYDEAEALRALDHAALEAVAAVHAKLRRAATDLMAGRGAMELPRTLRQAIAASLGRVRLAVVDLGADLDIAANESADMGQGEDGIDAIWAKVNAEMDAKEAARAAGQDGQIQ